MPVHLVHVSQDPRAPLVIRTSEEHVLAADRRERTESAESRVREFGLAVTSELAAEQLAEVPVLVVRPVTA